MSQKFLGLTAVSLALLGSGATLAPAAAQEQNQPRAGALDEIVVTATRREENLQEVPIAVTAFSAAQLEDRQIGSTVDLVRVVPNLVGHNNTGTATANTYFMRGLGSTEQIALLDPAVSTYVDEVLIPRQNVNNYALFDVERLEVLRGPQGTTFGRNSTGGAISVTLKKPGEEFGGFLTGGFGNYGREIYRGSVDVPLSPGVLTKFSAFKVSDDGWLNNITNGEKLNGSDNVGARAAVRFLPSEAVTIDLAYEYLQNEGIFSRSILGQRENTRTLVRSGGATGDVIADAIANRGQRNDTESQAVTANIGWEFAPGWTVNSISGWRTVDQDFVIDFSLPTAASNPFPFVLTNDGQYDVFTQELKFVGNFGDNIGFVGGLYYLYEDNITKAAAVLGGPAFGGASVQCEAGVAGDGNMTCGTVPGYSSDRDIRNETTSWAAYAQADIKFTPQLTGIIGVRYTDETKDLDLRPTARGGLTTANLRAAGVATSLSEGILTPKIGLDFKLSDDIMLYATATNGFKSGGWNSRTAYRPQTFQPMKPEESWAYEAGIKSELFENRLRLNVNAFLQQTDDLQLSYTTPGPVAGTTLSTQDNAGDIEVKGIEADFAAVITDQFSIFGSLGWQEGEYTRVNPRARSFCTTGTIAVPPQPFPNGCAGGAGFVNAIDLSDEPSRLPTYTATIGYRFDVPLAAWGDLKFTGDMSYNDGYWTTAANSSPRTIQTNPAATLDSLASASSVFNFGVAWDSPGGDWTVAFDCKNCGDTTYTVAVFNGVFYGDPRRTSLTLTRRF